MTASKRLRWSIASDQTEWTRSQEERGEQI